MKVVITYCTQWNYQPKASRAEEEIKSNFPHADILLIRGSGGIFDVEVDGTIVFSKARKIGTDTVRFPENGELTKLIQAMG